MTWGSNSVPGEPESVESGVSLVWSVLKVGLMVVFLLYAGYMAGYAHAREETIALAKRCAVEVGYPSTSCIKAGLARN